MEIINKTILTNLLRSTILYSVIVVVALIFYLINGLVASLIFLILTAVLFFNHLSSKRIIKIKILGDGLVEFGYLQFNVRNVKIQKRILAIKKRVSVTFRGGKDEIVEIWKTDSKTKLFDISKSELIDKDDFEFLLTYFDTQLEKD